MQNDCSNRASQDATTLVGSLTSRFLELIRFKGADCTKPTQQRWRKSQMHFVRTRVRARWIEVLGLAGQCLGVFCSVSPPIHSSLWKIAWWIQRELVAYLEYSWSYLNIHFPSVYFPCNEKSIKASSLSPVCQGILYSFNAGDTLKVLHFGFFHLRFQVDQSAFY